MIGKVTENCMYFFNSLNQNLRDEKLLLRKSTKKKCKTWFPSWVNMR